MMTWVNAKTLKVKS